MAEPPSTTARRFLGGGTEPDPRFTLANERTFLAWIRTGLALIAGAVALEGFGVNLDETVRGALAALLIIVGATVVIGAGVRWLRVERAMRHGRPLPFPTIIPFLIITLVMAGVILLVLVLE